MLHRDVVHCVNCSRRPRLDPGGILLALLLGIRPVQGLCIPLAPTGKDPVMPVDIRTILVATDFSEPSAAATAYAFSLARTLNAHLYVMHVVPEDDVRMLTAIRVHLQSEVTPEALTETLYAEADKHLTTLVEDARVTDLVQERLIVTGQPAAAIISWAAAKQAQVI